MLLKKYKGYVAQVTLDEDEKVLCGKVLNTKDTVTFESPDAGKIEDEFHASVDEYLEWCKRDGVEPNKDFSGEFRLRLGPILHAAVSEAAESTGESMNAYITRVLRNEPLIKV